MRVTGYTPMSLLDAMQGTKSSSIYSNPYANSTGLVHNWMSASTKAKLNQSTLNAYKKTDSLYTATKNAAVGVREHSEKLANTSADSVFAKAEAGDKSGAMNEINNFIKDYNGMLHNMSITGQSSSNILYKNQLHNNAIANKESLNAIGITVQKDGTLAVNQKTLENSKVEDLEKVFQGASSFAGNASVKSIYVEANAVEAMSEQNSMYSYLSSGYNNLGGYSSLLGSSSYGSGGFNSLLSSFLDSTI
ncbi:hypothetical protein [Anaeromicropila herbilytica]|uniref:Flagellar hook-associated protein 2 C-terminal domain-containing protein n=1 Tax=Anaeromicropila herbilytica TaxID=2785025 RepID=A0A7R7EHP0_9FIRM|nr:hypothetical protein [Anaeromicropila herbilytica]BCN29425.1 hypothetical protein bsdtb5_07200 [Anaeromicropila herbilytica]